MSESLTKKLPELVSKLVLSIPVEVIQNNTAVAQRVITYRLRNNQFRGLPHNLGLLAYIFTGKNRGNIFSREDIFAGSYFRERIFSREDIFAGRYFRGKIFSREPYIRENIFSRKYFKFTFREIFLPRK